MTTPMQAACTAAEREQESLPETSQWRTGYDLAVNGAAAKLDPDCLVAMADADVSDLKATLGRPLHTLEAARGFADGCIAVAKARGLT